jgi:hypothetical protein
MDIVRNLQRVGQDDETQAISIQLALEEIEQRIEDVRGTGDDRSGLSIGVERELNTIKDGIIAVAVELAERFNARAAERPSESPPAGRKLFDLFNGLNMKIKNPMKGSRAVVPNIAAQNPSTEKGESSTSSARQENLAIKDKQNIAASNENGKTSSNPPTHPPTTHKGQCVACMEKFLYSHLAKLSCGHEYCNECLTAMFQGATVEESHYPPRCCRKPISLELVLDFLSHEAVRDYLEKKLEWDTKNRTYCYNKKCLAFINPDTIKGKEAMCAKCRSKTCAKCKKIAHDKNVRCSEDEEIRRILQVIKRNNWRQCPRCKQAIE